MRLIVRKDGQDEKEFSTGKPIINIGRGLDCDLILSDRLVSRKHAVIKFDETEKAWTLEDLGSSNKTYLNDEVIKKNKIKAGDEIRIGDFSMEVSLGDAPELDRNISADETVEGEEVFDVAASLTTPVSETVVRKPDAQHAPAMRLSAKRLSDFSVATEALCDAESLDKMLAVLIDLLVKQFDAFHVWCAIREQPSGPMTYHVGKRRDGRKVEITDLQLQDKVVQAIERKQSSVMPRVSAQMQSKDRIRSAMIAPILRRSGCFGILYVDNAMVHNHYSLSDLDYLMFLAMHIAAILKRLLDI
ncbi:MAG: FHA domain-containing protein [Phycisphaerae bacterium]|jgi:pSer/pThr/pTyr-binding forkhead associated (FHA) protein